MIADYAFYGCARVSSIIIPDSVTSIGDYAFSDCSSLTSVYYKGSASDWNNISIRYDYYLTNATKYYYSGSQPTEEGNYWHYDEKGKVVVW